MENKKYLPKVQFVYCSDAKPRRGYHSYVKTYSFNKEEKCWNFEEQKDFMLNEFNNERSTKKWMWIHPPKMEAEDYWIIKLGFDSGD